MVVSIRARYLAPIALAAAAVGSFVIVNSGLQTDHPATSHRQPPRHAPVTHGKFARAKFYTVQVGDSLTAIAAKTGIPLATLEALNPTVSPDSLQTGQRLRLRQ